MITEPTVLVLGAGASKPYGFPSGKELKDLVCKRLYYDLATEFKQPGKTLMEIGFTKEEIQTFRDALYFSGRSSVDAFLWPLT